ncbi:MAG: FecR domain-containing protein [Mediterranea sp.]|jgi:ferric-dicitrate binding protein FerR (iron transport regulator)|nr:FecR domain-containing protein [Mediterranea sp.]
MRVTKEHQIKKIFENYFSLDSEKEGRLRASFRSWFARNAHRKEVSKVLEKLFKQTVVPDENPDEEVYRSYDALAERLGINHPTPALSPVEAARRRHRPMRQWLRTAAVVVPLLIVGGGGWYLLTQNETDGGVANVVKTTAVSTIVSPVPAKQEWVKVVAKNDQKLLLPDSSSISVQENSRLEYEKNFSSNRVISLTGEARFKVYKQPNKAPFTVRAGGISVVATGTDFNVKAYEKAHYVLVSLYEGGLDVTCARGNLYKLVGGQELFYDKESGRTRVHEIERPKLSDTVSMQNVSLQHMMGWIERHYGVRVEYGAPEMELRAEDTLLTVNFESTVGLDDLLSMMSVITGSFSYTIDKADGNTVTVHILPLR